jgi:glycosyltransferase involved in cell wall biosynthesis
MSDAVISIPSSEGYGFTVYEAMGAGCPTVISDLPVFEHDLVDGVHTLKVAPTDANQMARALSDLLNGEETRETLCRNALGLVQRMGVSHRVESVTSLYRELVLQ